MMNTAEAQKPLRCMDRVTYPYKPQYGVGIVVDIMKPPGHMIRSICVEFPGRRPEWYQEHRLRLEQECKTRLPSGSIRVFDWRELDGKHVTLHVGIDVGKDHDLVVLAAKEEGTGTIYVIHEDIHPSEGAKDGENDER